MRLPRNAPDVGAGIRPSRPLFGVAPRASAILAACLALCAVTGCGRPKETKLVGRLWVTDVPTSPQQRVGAVMFTDVAGRRLGVLHQGSAYRSQHEAVQWLGSDERGELLMLQDGRKHAVKVETCTPSRGFDLCVRLIGDPMGFERYQSRKRWSVKPRATAASVDEAGIEAAVLAIAAADPDVALLAEAL